MGALTLLAVLGVTLTVRRITGVPHAQSFFFAVAILIVALYAAGLLGVLWSASLALQAAGIALLGLEALRLSRQRAGIAIPLPFGVLALLCCWFWVVHGDDQYMLYDEYSHWGIFIKEMLALDGFWSGETSSIHPRYPPGAPLWQYFFNALLPPSESRVYLAQFVLLLAPLLMLWNNLRWSQAIWSVAILAIVVLAIANFGLSVSTLYVDQLVGVWYAGTLLAAIADDKLVSRRVVIYAAPLTAIAIFKDAGLAFALSGAAIVAALFFYRALALERSWSSAWKTGAALTILLAPPLLCAQAWSWNRDAVGAPRDVYSVGGIVSGLAARNAVTDTARDAEIGRRLQDVFFNQQISNSAVSWDYNEYSYDIRDEYSDSYRLTTFGLAIAFLLWWAALLLYVLPREWRQPWLVVAAGVLVTAGVYVALLHSSYRFAFGPRGIELPSYVRYIHVVALPMFLVSFAPLLPAFQGRGVPQHWLGVDRALRRRAATLATAMLALYALETPYLERIIEPNPRIPARAALEPVLEPIRSSVGRSKLWIYFPSDTANDFFGRMVQYLLVPTPTAVERSESFLQAADVGELAAAWRPFDYVWIPELPSVESGVGLARFTGGAATLGLYRVVASPDGNVTLKAFDAQGDSSLRP